MSKWYPAAVERPPAHLLPTGHEADMTPPAPGELETLRSFLALHDHTAESVESLAPSAASLEWWLRWSGLLDGGESASESDLAWAADVHEALHSKVLANMGDPLPDRDARILDDAARDAGVRVTFAEDGVARISPTAGGVAGAIGRLLALLTLAELDGSWGNFKECGSPTCRAVFYDRSKNHTGRWCSMRTCGNRMKVRAWRERQAAG